MLIVICLFATMCVVKAVGEPYVICGESVAEYPLPALPYGYGGLEPYIDAKTVEAHYAGHHEAYRQKLNKALADWREKETKCVLCNEPIIKIIQQLGNVPQFIRHAVQNNGGGFVNHALYWGCLSPNPSGVARQPNGQLLNDIMKTFGSFENFQKEFTAKSLALFGSGYVWLSRQPGDSNLVLSSTVNQDSPIGDGLHPILVIDLWEHAYYLKHQFRRVNHVSDWWNLVDWHKVEKLDQWWQVSSNTKDNSREL